MCGFYSQRCSVNSIEKVKKESSLRNLNPVLIVKVMRVAGFHSGGCLSVTPTYMFLQSFCYVMQQCNLG